MSFMSPKTSTPKEAEAKPLDMVQDRGKVGRTILAGALPQEENKYKKKTILGG